MSYSFYDLHSEFPDDGDILHQLKLTNGRFPTLAQEYHTHNKEIQRIENGIEASSDERLEELKKQRLLMLDEVSSMIGSAKAA